MSRKQFNATKSSLFGSEASQAQSSKSIDTFGSFAGGRRAARKIQGRSNQSTGSRSDQAGSITLPPNVRPIESIPDSFNPLEGGRRSKEEPTVGGDLSDEDSGFGPATTMGMPSTGKLPGKRTASQKQNIELLTGNPNNGKPRDRDLPKNQIHVANRKHLPAPPLGSVAGHGLTLEKFRERSSFSEDFQDTHSKDSGDESTSQWRA